MSFINLNITTLPAVLVPFFHNKESSKHHQNSTTENCQHFKPLIPEKH